MKTIITLLVIIALTLPTLSVAQRSEYRDRHGNLVGTKEPKGSGFEYRDRHNNLVGTERRQGDRIEFRDRHNNLVGEERLED